MKRVKSHKRAFTLIELLVVVLIIGILAAVAVPQYQKAVGKAEAMRMMPVLEAVGKAQEIYFLANGSYATDISQLDIDLPAGGSISEGDEDRVFYPKFYCTGLTRGISLTCYFPVKHPLHPLHLERYFFPLSDRHNAKLLCWALKTSANQQQICQSLGGVQEEYTGDNKYSLYVLD